MQVGKYAFVTRVRLTGLYASKLLDVNVVMITPYRAIYTQGLHLGALGRPACCRIGLNYDSLSLAAQAY